MLRKLAQEARLERAASHATTAMDEREEVDRRERDEVREDRRRERERDLRMQRNKSSASRNDERDVSEKIALGMAAAPASSETMYDQRLFNQSQGMDSGFGEDDSYNVYSKPLFAGSSANTLYRPKKDMDSENYGSEQDFQKLLDTSKFKPDKNFTGIERDGSKSQTRDKPVEFERNEPDEDLFGLTGFFNAAKTGAKPLDKIGKTENLHASAGNAMTDSSGSSKRKSINFEPSSTASKKR